MPHKWLSICCLNMFRFRMLDHAKSYIALDVYGHLLPSKQIEAVEKIDVLIAPVM